MRTGCTGCDTGIPHLHMSDLGSCVKSQVAGLLGYKPVAAPEKMEAIYARGHAHEEECAEAMRPEWQITEQQKELVLDGVIPVYGHLDGIIQHTDGIRFAGDAAGAGLSPMVWEAKAPGAWARFEQAVRLDSWTDPLMHRYAYQISCYMHATGLEALVCCVDDGRVKTFGIECAPISLTEIQERVEWIAHDVNRGVLTEKCSQDDYPCPFIYLHTDTKPDRTVITDEATVTLTAEYARFSKMESSGKAGKKKLRPEMDKTFGVVGDYTAGINNVTVYKMDKKSYLDEDAMKRDGIDVESYRKSDGESVAMKVTPRKGV